jgi:bifunctional non-homologous end joining protein LigD
VLDGEIVAIDPRTGLSSFARLQQRMQLRDAVRAARTGVAVRLYLFDCLYYEGVDLTNLPLVDRKKVLRDVVWYDDPIYFTPHRTTGSAAMYRDACARGAEGIIAKRADSRYVGARSGDWLKIKCVLQQEFVIGGYTAPQGSREHLGALLVGYHEDGKLRYAGKVGTGFDEHLLQTLSARLAKLKRPDSPLVDPPRERGIQWVKAQLVCEVAFTERTDDGILRQASFMGLREDIPPKSVGEERPQQPPGARKAEKEAKQAKATRELQGVSISHPDRIAYPALNFTKLDLARYYDEVSEAMLPHLAGRPLTLVRCPDGVERECFYQRHLAMGASPGEVKTFKRLRSSKGYYIYVDSLRGILSMVQNGAIEMHTWGATLPDTRHPDRITLDLDPGEDLPWAELRRATEITRTLVDGLGLKCFLKTTGGKGLHVVVPVARKWGSRSSW